MKYPALAKYTNIGLRDTLIKLAKREDLSEEEKERRGNMVYEELVSRGEDPIIDMINDIKDLVDKMPKKGE